MNPNPQSKPKWIPSMVALVVMAMMTAMVEPAAFARSGDEAPKTEQDVAERVVAKTLPNRPVIVATALPPQLQTRALPAPTTRPAAAPQNTGKSKKWILILAAAGAGVVTAVLLTRGDDEPEGTITVGSPVVGGPQ
jgi:hypothetical protein